MMKQRKGLTSQYFENAAMTVYRLYDTVILKNISSSYVLNSGGWKTNHTKNCINDNLPEGYKVFQKKGCWYVDTPEGIIEFIDGMLINTRSNI